MYVCNIRIYTIDTEDSETETYLGSDVCSEDEIASSYQNPVATSNQGMYLTAIY